MKAKNQKMRKEIILLLDKVFNAETLEEIEKVWQDLIVTLSETIMLVSSDLCINKIIKELKDEEKDILP